MRTINVDTINVSFKCVLLMCLYRIGDCKCVANSYRVYTDGIIDPTSTYDVPFEARNFYTLTHTHAHARARAHTHTHTTHHSRHVSTKPPFEARNEMLMPLPTP